VLKSALNWHVLEQMALSPVSGILILMSRVDRLIPFIIDWMEWMLCEQGKRGGINAMPPVDFTSRSILED
jgi:hypothetical protein